MLTVYLAKSNLSLSGQGDGVLLSHFFIGKRNRLSAFNRAMVGRITIMPTTAVTTTSLSGERRDFPAVRPSRTRF